MSDIWYKTKEWFEYWNNISNFTIASESTEAIEILKQLRSAAENYHQSSLQYSARNISADELKSYKNIFVELKNNLDNWVATQGPIG